MHPLLLQHRVSHSCSEERCWCIQMAGRGVPSVSILPSSRDERSPAHLAPRMISGQDTGYKHADPVNPCRRCWDSYAQKPNSLLISSAGLHGAKVLQKPLPRHQSYGAMPPGMSGGYPGSLQGQQRPINTGGSFQSPHMTGHYSPPAHPPPPQPPQRPGPPQVNRAEEASETLEDENGEAPPAYDDAVAAGPDGVLPPQRRNSNGHLIANHTGDSSHGIITNSSSSQHTGHSAAQHTGGPYAPPLLAPTNLPSPHQIQHQPMYPPHQSPMSPGWYPPSTPIMSYGHRPPPGALILQPGDPRIGGQLCLKCGGAGVRESLWWGDETCSRCAGSGRVF